MKTLKKITCTLLLLLATMGAFAQENSIYGLEVSVTDNVMTASFYSNYEKEATNGIGFKCYDLMTNALKEGGNTAFLFKYNNLVLEGKPHQSSYTEEGNGVIKVTIIKDLNNTELENKSFRTDFYLILRPSLRSGNLRADGPPISNVLSYTHYAETSSINDVPAEMQSATTNFYSLQGYELAAAPVNTPYIELAYTPKGSVVAKKKMTRQ